MIIRWKHRWRNVAAAVLLCAGLASCSQDDLPGNQQGGLLPDGEYPLMLTASVDEMKTRAAGKNAWTDGDAIGVRIGADGAAGHYKLNADGTVKEAVTPVYWQNAAPADVKAWYPYTPQEDVDISDQSKGFAAFDYLAAVAENRTFQNAVELKFKHRMAKVSYTLKGEGITSDELTSATVQIAGYTSATFAEGELTGKNQGWITPTSDKDALLVPQDMTGKRFIKVSIKGNDFYYTPASMTSGGLLEAGKHYHYTITVMPYGIKVTKATGEWADGGSVAVLSYKIDLSTAKVGDLITASGKLIDVDDLDKLTYAYKKQVVGVVFWTPAETDYTEGVRSCPARLTDDKIMSSKHQNCTHGLAVAIKAVTYNNDAAMKWQNQRDQSVTDWQKANENFNPDATDFVSICGYHKEGEFGNHNKIYGYQNSVVLRAYNAYCKENSMESYIMQPVAALDEFVKVNSAPAGSTGWFIPSKKELVMLCYKDVDGYKNGTTTRDIVTRSLGYVGGDEITSTSTTGNKYEYWTSSEGDYEVAMCVQFSDANYYTPYKTSGKRVRAVCAF